MVPESTVSIYGLMVASYMVGDPVTACAMADQFKKSSREPHVGFIKSSISVYASCSEFDKADQMRLELGKLGRETIEVDNIDRRLSQWKSVYQMKTQAGGAEAQPGAVQAQNQVAQTTPENEASIAQRAQGGNDGSPRMVLVDVVMVSTQELITAAKRYQPAQCAHAPAWVRQFSGLLGLEHLHQRHGRRHHRHHAGSDHSGAGLFAEQLFGNAFINRFLIL